MPSRWPANVILSPKMAEVIDGQSGTSKSIGGSRGAGGQHGAYSPIAAQPDVKPGYGDEGGASRFFLKAGYEPWELEWIIANGLTPCGE